MRPAAGLKSWAGGINRFGDIPHHLLQISDDVPVSFVERAPTDDRWVVPVAQQDLGPLVDISGIALGLETETPVSRFSPDHVAELVSPVEEPRLEDFLMQTRAIIAARHAHLDILLQRLVRRRSPEPVGIKPLVKYEPLENWFAVDQDAAPVDGHTAQAEITVQRINFLITAGERELEIIKVRGARRPEFLCLEVNHQRVLPRARGRVRADRLAVDECFGLE